MIGIVVAIPLGRDVCLVMHPVIPIFVRWYHVVVASRSHHFIVIPGRHHLEVIPWRLHTIKVIPWTIVPIKFIHSGLRIFLRIHNVVFYVIDRQVFKLEG